MDLDVISSNYLTPTEYSHATQIELQLDVYKMLNSVGAQTSLTYYTTFFGYCAACNVTVDSTTNARLTASVSLALDKSIEDDLLIKPNSLIWFDTAIKITKIYHLYNADGSWTNKKVVFGYIFPNQDSISYSADTRELSVNGADIISCLNNIRGGTLLDGLVSLENDATLSQGLLIEGEKDDAYRYDTLVNYFMVVQRCNVTNPFDIPEQWEDAYDAFTTYYREHPEEFLQSSEVYTPKTCNDVYNVIINLWKQYLSGMYHWIPYVDLHTYGLPNNTQLIPKDLEFDNTATLYDVYTEIVNLYPNQTFYFDNNLRLTFEELPVMYNQYTSWCDMYARDLSNLVISEQINYNLENITNYVIVWGKDNSCCGKYMIRSGYQCQHDHNLGTSVNDNPIYTTDIGACPICGEDLTPIGDNFDLSADRIGIHKKVINSDSYRTDYECEQAAKAECLLANRFNETITLTIADTWLKIFEKSNLSVGRRIEYTSIATEETDTYVLDKLSNDFSSGTWTLELYKFYPIYNYDDGTDQWLIQHSADSLVKPTFTYTLSNTGLLTMTINNGNGGCGTQYSMYKIYLEEAFTNYQSDMSLNRNTFIGETCTTNDNNATKTFTYQFTKDGEYKIKCKAYAPNVLNSRYSDTQTITVNCFASKLKFNTEDYLKIDDGYLLIS